MPAPTWDRVRTVLLDALDRPAADRAAFVDAACRDARGAPEPEVRAEVDRLLRAHIAAETAGALTSAFDTHDPLPPAAGPWVPSHRLGAGGMGVVYAATRRGDGFEQRAALKLVRPGFGPDFADRFVRERAVLAGLDHPGVARLLDGGLTDDGLPYLVVELVEGTPITAYADAHGLDLDGRLALFLQVCSAVAYAHRRLVVHRDLKPSNVLVDGEGHVKLLDFGIAKLLDDVGDLTRTRGPLSPPYAAPEQFTGGTITTATDVYALGALAYELVTGTRPLDLKGLTAGAAEALVTTRDPEPPSERASQPRALRGDLDAIVLRALAKEPDRRYPSADALAADVRRYLEGLPVEARPATLGYRLRRFGRRHRTAVAAAAAVAIALVGGLGAALWQGGIARQEAAKASAVEAFLSDVLAAPDPIAEGRDVRVADVLDRAAASLDTAFVDQPEVRAAAHRRLGQTYFALGLYDESAGQYRRALAIHDRVDGPDAEATARAQLELGTTLRDLADFDTADSLLARSLDATRARFGEASPEVALVLAEIANLRHLTGDAVAAEATYRRVLEIEETTRPPGDIETILSVGNLAVAQFGIEAYEEAARLLDRQIRLYREYQPAYVQDRANALSNLGAVYARLDRHQDAARAQTEAVALFRSAVGDDHRDTAFGLSGLGATLVALGRADEAEPLLRESVATYRAALGDRHPTVGYPLVHLAAALRDLGQLDDAAGAVAEAEGLFREGFGADHPSLERALETRASIAALR